MVDFTAINERALEYFDNVMEWLGLEGEHRGAEFVAYNPTRLDDNLGSFSINRNTGKWADFALGVQGGDVVGYVAYVKRLGQGAAAKVLEDFLDLLDGGQTPPPATGGRVVAPSTTGTMGHPIATDVLVTPIPVGTSLPSFIPGFGKPDVVYPYKDSAGQDLFYVLRRNAQQGGSKAIRPLTLWQAPSGQTQWKLEGMPAPRPLYNLDQMAQQPTAPILIVEGEKAADTARNLFPQGVVTTTPNGAQGVDKADLTPLKDRTLVIWPDHDKPGEEYAHDIQETLAQLGHSGPVTVIRPADWHPTYDAQGGALLAPQTVAREKGWDAADAVGDGWTAAHLLLLLAQTPPEPGQPVKAVPPLWETSYDIEVFSVSDQGVVAHIPQKGKRSGYDVRVSSRIDVTYLTRDEGSTNWGLLLRFGDRDGHIKEWAMPSEMLAGDGTDYRSVLSNLGATLGSKLEARSLLGEYFTAAQPTARALCTTTIGWHGKMFVLPNEVFGESQERVILQSRNPANVGAFEAKGTLAEWQQHVGDLCVGNSRLVLAVCTALAGPLLKPLDEENGGFHLRGASSRGKTKALKVAASVWGSASLMKTWRATSNGLEGVALQQNDTVLLLDELGQCGGKEAAEAVYMLANGEGKARATTSGAARLASRWRLLFLSTGEVDLAQHMAADGHGLTIRAGQEVRFLDIPADGGQNMGLFEDLHGIQTAGEFATTIDEATNRYYGTLGPALLRHLTADQGLDAFRTAVASRRDAFVQSAVPAGADGQVSRAAKRFGLLVGVGEAAIAAGLLPWTPGEAEQAVKRCFDAWLVERGGTGAMEEWRAIEQVRRILERDGDSRFDPLGGNTDPNLDGTEDIRNRLGYKRRDGQDLWEYWVLPEAYRTELCRGSDPKIVTRTLKDRGYLKVGSDGKPQVARNLPGIGTKKVYVILPTIWNDLEEREVTDEAA